MSSSIDHDHNEGPGEADWLTRHRDAYLGELGRLGLCCEYHRTLQPRDWSVLRAGHRTRSRCRRNRRGGTRGTAGRGSHTAVGQGTARPARLHRSVHRTSHRYCCDCSANASGSPGTGVAQASLRDVRRLAASPAGTGPDNDQETSGLSQALHDLPLRRGTWATE